MSPVPSRITIIDRGCGLDKRRTRTSTFLASLPTSGVAYGTTYTLGIVIGVAKKTVGILLTVLLGLNPVHLSSHRTGLVCTNSIEWAPPHSGPMVCTFNIVPCSRHQPTMVLNWPEQAPSTNITWPTSHGYPPPHAYHIISIRTRSGALHAPSAPLQGKSSHSGRYHQRNGSRQGISPKLLNHHHPHGIQRSHRANLPSISRGSLTANLDPPTTSPTNHHIT